MASARELALGLFSSRLSLGLPNLDVCRRLQHGLHLVDALRAGVLWLLFRLVRGAISARHGVCLRVQQVTSGLFTPTALPMHATLTAARSLEAQAGAW